MTWARPIPKLSTTEAIATHCPLCGARPGEPCQHIDPSYAYSISTNAILRRSQIGQPTRRPHNARYDHPARRLRQWLAEYAPIFWET